MSSKTTTKNSTNTAPVNASDAWDAIASESESIAIGAAVHTADCAGPVVGLAYGLEVIELNDADSFGGKRAALALLVRLVAPAQGKRNDTIGEVKAGEDVKVIVGATMQQLALFVANNGPCAVKLERKGKQKLASGRSVTQWACDVRTVPPRLLATVAEAHKLRAGESVAALARVNAGNLDADDDGR